MFKTWTSTVVSLSTLLLWATNAPADDTVTAKAPDKPDATPPAVDAPAPAAPVETAEEKKRRKEKALEHFNKGAELFKKKDYDGAVAEYEASMKLAPSWAATWNAARCLQQLQRYDEAVDMMEILFRQYDADINKEKRVLMQEELVRLRSLVGAIDVADAEFDAAIRIDGRNRGTFPTAAPHRVSVGSHVVRVFKEGYDPFETSVDVAGNQVQLVRARLRKLDLDRAGRLRVTESNQRELDVIIDGSVVGKTPWEGQLRDGDHSVVLEGEDDWGTPPAIVTVTKGRTETLGLVAERLEAFLRIAPTPVGATVAIDGVSVGRGVWQGRVRTGRHRIEIGAAGYVLDVQDVALTKGKNEPLVVKLDRDPLSPLWKDNRGRVFVEGGFGVGGVPTFGGDLSATCNDGCTYGLGVGTAAAIHGGYRFPSGFFVGVDAGYFYARQKISNRRDELTLAGGLLVPAPVDDTLSLRGMMAGISAGIRVKRKLPVSFRLGAGVLMGAKLRDHRVGLFQMPSPYAADVIQYHSTFALYIAPSVQFGYPLAERLHLQLGLDALVFLWPGAVPKWSKTDVGSYVRGDQGLAGFVTEAMLMSSNLLSIMPSTSVRYEF